MIKNKFKGLEQAISADYGNITGIIIQKDGESLYENYFNGFGADDAVHVFSVTKSVFSALVGIAVEKGHIRSADAKILDFFPGYPVKSGEDTIREVTIKDVLTMTAPYKFESEPYDEFFMSGDWVKFALDQLGGKKHPGEFIYSPIIGAHILSGVLAAATGRPILDFAAENLFSPLGIENIKNVAFGSQEDYLAWYSKGKHKRGWAADPQGISAASWGLTLTPADMAKIGRLYLNGGKWDGKQVVSSDWINESLKEHAKWGALSYGYLWWVINAGDRICAALGDGGNAVYINAKKKAVVSVASLLIPETPAKDALELIAEYVEPVI